MNSEERKHENWMRKHAFRLEDDGTELGTPVPYGYEKPRGTNRMPSQKAKRAKRKKGR